MLQRSAILARQLPRKDDRISRRDSAGIFSISEFKLVSDSMHEILSAILLDVNIDSDGVVNYK